MEKNMVQNIDSDRKLISIILKQYIECILKEYQDIIPMDIKTYLENIINYEEIVNIENTGTISLFVHDGKLYLPLDAYKVLNIMSNIPGFGINKKHQTYNSQSMIINDNTYLTFVKHVFLKGLSPLQYFKEILLHETMHLCGSGGYYALDEGFNELKTRQVASKYQLETSCCGYPKETKIAYELEQLFGKDIGDKLIFASNLEEKLRILNLEVSIEASNLYRQVFFEMQRQFEPYMNKKYPGMIGIKNKCDEYAKIDYSKVYLLINNYKNYLKNIDATTK